MKFINLLLIISIALFSGCSTLNQNANFNQNLIENPKILRTSDNKILNYDEFIADINDSDILLLGERHNHTLDQSAERKIIASFPNSNIVFEMLSSKAQNEIDSAKSKKSQIHPNSLETTLKWEWNAYKNYRKIVELAFYGDYKMFGGNISKAEIQTIYEGAQPIHGIKSTTQQVRKVIKDVIAITHKVKDEQMLEKMTEIQQFKDRRMADILAHCNGNAILLAGFFHTNKKIGVPLHLSDFATTKKISVIVFSHKKGDEIGSDYIWLD